MASTRVRRTASCRSTIKNTIATGGLVNLPPGEVTKGIQARDPRSRMNDRRSFEEATGRQA
jgi:hypothetical protein